ncbi:MAG: FmdB family zinc ribbon protein [Desulfobacteraceae bacterium]
MPLFDYHCKTCGKLSEILMISSEQQPICRHCGGSNLEKIMSAPSSLTGAARSGFPGPGDTACCGSSPGAAAGCAGPGSCCGRTKNL